MELNPVFSTILSTNSLQKLTNTLCLLTCIQAIQAVPLEVSVNLPTSKPDYAFVSIKSQGLVSLSSNLKPVYWNFDTDSLYTSYRLNKSLLLEQKTHLFDYNNLNHVFSSNQLTEVDSLSYMASSISPGLRMIGSKGSLSYQAGFSMLIARLQNQKFSSDNFTVYAPKLAGSLTYSFTNKKPQNNSVTVGASSSYYNRGISQAALNDSGIHQLYFRQQHTFTIGSVYPMLTVQGTGIFNNDGKPATDNLVKQSIGGPEQAYNRLIGFPFSGFRSARYLKVSLDIPVTITKDWTMVFILERAYLDNDFAPIADGAGALSKQKFFGLDSFIQLGTALNPSISSFQIYGGVTTYL